MCRFLCGYKLLTPLGKHQEIRWIVKNMFRFIRNHHTVFHTGCMIGVILNSYISYCFISSPTSDALSVLDFDHSNLCVVIFSYYFNLHFPVTHDVEHMFMLFCRVYIFFDRVSVKVLGLFHNWVVLSFIDCAFGIVFKEAAAAAKSLQSCPTLCDPIDCSLPGSSVHGIFQARVVQWGAIAFSVKEATHCIISITWHSGKGKIMETVKKKINDCHRLERKKGWIGRAQGFLEKWKYSVWYCNGENIGITHLSNPIEGIIPGVNLNTTLDFGWWCVNAGLSVITKVLLWWGVLTLLEAMYVWGQGVYEESLYLLFNSSMNRKQL